MPCTISTPALRNLMDQFLLSDSALEAFVLDHFPQVMRLYGHGMDRTAKVTLLFQHADCNQIYDNLRQRFPQAVPSRANGCPHASNPNPTQSTADNGPAPAEGKSSVRYFLVLTGTVDELDEPKIRALVNHIRKISGDAELTLEALKPGSVVLHFRGTKEGMERLRDAFRSGELREVLGHRLQDIGQDQSAIDNCGDSHEVAANDDTTINNKVHQNLLGVPAYSGGSGQHITHLSNIPRPLRGGRDKHNLRSWLRITSLIAAMIGIGAVALILFWLPSHPPNLRKSHRAESASYESEALLKDSALFASSAPDMSTQGPGRLLVPAMALQLAPAMQLTPVPVKPAAPAVRPGHQFAILNNGQASFLNAIILSCAREHLAQLPLREGAIIKLERSGTLVVVEGPPAVYASGFNLCLRQSLSRVAHFVLPQSFTLQVLR